MKTVPSTKYLYDNSDHRGPVGFLTATFVLGACVWGGFFWSVLNWLEVL